MKKTEETPEYIRIGNTPIHITKSDNPDFKYMALAYDYKLYSWRNADIYADTTETIKMIAHIVYGNTDLTQDKELNITIDYQEDAGPQTDTSEQDDNTRQINGGESPHCTI